MSLILSGAKLSGKIAECKFSLLDNAPNFLVGCVIQKRLVCHSSEIFLYNFAIWFQVTFHECSTDKWKLFFHSHFCSRIFCKIGSDESEIFLCCKLLVPISNYVFILDFFVKSNFKFFFVLQDGWNIFDFVIVVLSFVELLAEGIEGLSMLRSFR